MNYRPSLPHDLFHSHIIPDIVSEHLHLLLVENEPPSWHAFYALPLVSFEFRNSCQSLYTPMFGLRSTADYSVIHEIVMFAQSLWKLARLPPEQTEPPSEPPKFSYIELMSKKSLIGVYISIAISRSFLNLDVLWPMMRQATVTELGGTDHNEHPSEDYPVSDTRQFRMQDEKLHRAYMPLTCATKLCDFITPARLTYTVAEHLANIIPIYSTIPVLLKYTQDLETCVVRSRRIQGELYVPWTLQTLRLIECSAALLVQMQTMGCLVNSFSRISVIPDEVVQLTKIIPALRNIMDADWGESSEEIHGRASALRLQWTHLQ